MASPFQQQALRRKLIYAALIIVLFTVAFIWRKADFKAFGMDVWGVNKQAEQLAIREESRGEVDLIGAVVRLSTMGLRGVATCVMWIDAMDAQKKNQWNELEIRVRSLTKLQPHFITPWIFQSWNLAYNVSVESDRVSDKYFYISRGIGLLAEGERQNRDNPDMRWSIGFFLQHKIGQSDETNTLRSLSQLSMIPPNERDPGRFWKAIEASEEEKTRRERGQELNYQELEDFCKKHPQLVRRLREGIRRERRSDAQRQFRCERIEEMVQFLTDNFRVPSLWQDRLPSSPGLWKEDADKLLPVADRFPALPPKHQARPEQQPPDEMALTNESVLRDEDDVHQIARSWYSYSQEPIPAPDILPGNSKPIKNPVYQRLPKHMTTLIFRDHPAQAQRFTAERLSDEGWFDDSGWTIPDWFGAQNDRFSNGPALVGGGRKWGLEAWQKTYELWRNFGEANHLLLNAAEEDVMLERAKSFAEKYKLNEGSPVPQLRAENLDRDTAQEYFAWQFMKWYNYYRHISNFPHHYNRALVESREETVLGRKTFFEADALRLRNRDFRALQKYQEPNGLRSWRDKVLLTNTEFRRDNFIQEQTFEVQIKYVDLYSRLGGSNFKAQAASMAFLPSQPAGAGVCPTHLLGWLNQMVLVADGKDKDGKEKFRANWGNPLLGGPFDGYDDKGVALIEDHSRDTVLRRMFPTVYAAADAEKSQPGQKPTEPPKRK
ncbi:MAG TPA: hypothetical protein VH682_09120 [Gemmataceae bacterium]